MHTLNINNPIKVRNIKYKLKHYISTMVIRGSYMFEFSICKEMKKYIYNKGGGSREGSGKFMSNTNCQGIENQC